jgi:hypothetical protein
MADDFGILISAPNKSAVGAKTEDILLSSSHPFIKIDTQNPVGFQTITLIITTDPPEPSVIGVPNYTQLYKFKHGYTYVPSLESLFYVSSAPPAPYNSATQTYFQDSGTLGGATINASAFLYAIADDTWVYIYCSKVSFDGSITLLTGTNVQITPHVFVEDIGAP